MLILVGESSSGKSSIEKYIVDNYGYNKIVSYTTRPPRAGEVDGVDYNYISKEEFLEKQSNGFFAEVGQYNDWFYGTAKKDCTDDKIAVLTPHGMRQIKRINGINTICVYIKVPRRDRLIKILQRGDNVDESYRRNLSDVGQFDGIEDEVDFVFENEGYVRSIKEMGDAIMNDFHELKHSILFPKVSIGNNIFNIHADFNHERERNVAIKKAMNENEFLV